MKKIIIKVVLAIIIIVFVSVILLIFTSAAKAEDNLTDKERAALEHQRNGNKYDDNGKFKEAIAEYKESLKYAPDDPNTNFNLGHVYLKTNHPEEAAKAFEKVIEIDPKDTEAHNLLGIAFKGCGKINEAIMIWEKSLKINPNQSEVQQMIKETKETESK